MRQSVVGLCLLFSAVQFAGCDSKEEFVEPTVGSVSQGLVPERSLAITDEFTLEPFTLERVLQKIIDTSGVTSVTPTQLFQQWWDTQNMGPSLGLGPHCDDEITAGQPSLNGYPWECPRGEGYQAFIDPFTGDPNKDLYIPIGLFNRFDLAPANGAHCGEYRIAFGMRQGHPDQKGRNLLIFEAVMPNPDPGMGIAGCFPLVKTWFDLSYEPDPMARRDVLESMFFDGIHGFEPVVHADHYGTFLGGEGYGCSTGQIRTNQFIEGEWNLREFRLVQDCRCPGCKLVIAPTTVKNNPWGELWDGSSPHPNAPILHSEVINAVWSLGNGGPNQLGWTVPNELNSGESLAFGGGPYDYLNIFNVGAGIDPTFFLALDAQTNAVWGGAYDVQHIVTRAQSQSCAGCHHTTNGMDIGGEAWPHSLNFVHVMEVPAAGSYPISDALRDVFLPYRAELLSLYVETGGWAAPTETKCEIPIPPELHVECSEEVSEQVLVRSFAPSGLEALVPENVRRVRTLGGGRVH